MAIPVRANTHQKYKIMLKEFKEFAFKGNLIDMASGIVIGGAFGLVVKSLVDHIIMPLIAGLFNMPDFSQMYYAFAEGAPQGNLEKAQEMGAVVAYGTFINTVINLLIIAASLFIVIKKVMGAMKKEEVAAPVAPPQQEVLLGEIRDLLKK
ncbi:MAG: large conductance mechanosensitive channel protein MscL [Akkermansiaceae bacterium]